MTSLRWIFVGVGVVLAAAFAWWWQGRDDRLREEGALEALIREQGVKDSVMMATLQQLGLKLDSSLVRSDTVIRTFIRTTEKVPVPGGIESVYVDTAFAKLPDSAKVEVLRRLGLQVANECNVLRQDCIRFRDSAMRAFRIKDSTITFWQDRYRNKPRRSCGPGGTAGYGAVSTGGEVKAGFGVTAGITCTF